MTAPVPDSGDKTHWTYAYQKKQFNVGSPAGIGPTDKSIFDSLANPETSALTAAAVTPLEEDAEWRDAHSGESKIQSGRGGA